MENDSCEEAQAPGLRVTAGHVTTFHLGRLSGPSLPFAVGLNGQPVARSNLSRV